MNHPGLSFVESGWVQITNRNWILSAWSIPESEESEKLLVTHPLWESDANTGTGDDAPFGTGASVDRVLG